MKELYINKRLQFMIIFLGYIVHGIGIWFNVMILMEGFTEVRPVNSIPVPAGLLCGPVGSLACACGNLAADCFGQLAPSSSLGFLGNFVGAWLPFRLWYVYRDEKPNVHSMKNLLLYIWLTLVGALAVSWMLCTGLWLIFGVWTETLTLYIFLNDFCFPIIFGLPVFIVMTAPEVNFHCAEPLPSIIRIENRKKRTAALIYTILLAVVFVITILGVESLKGAIYFLSVPLAVLSLGLLL